MDCSNVGVLVGHSPILTCARFKHVETVPQYHWYSDSMTWVFDDFQLFNAGIDRSDRIVRFSPQLRPKGTEVGMWWETYSNSHPLLRPWDSHCKKAGR